MPRGKSNFSFSFFNIYLLGFVVAVGSSLWHVGFSIAVLFAARGLFVAVRILPSSCDVQVFSSLVAACSLQST